MVFQSIIDILSGDTLGGRQEQTPLLRRRSRLWKPKQGKPGLSFGTAMLQPGQGQVPSPLKLWEQQQRVGGEEGQGSQTGEVDLFIKEHMAECPEGKVCWRNVNRYSPQRQGTQGHGKGGLWKWLKGLVRRSGFNSDTAWGGGRRERQTERDRRKIERRRQREIHTETEKERIENIKTNKQTQKPSKTNTS